MENQTSYMVGYLLFGVLVQHCIINSEFCEVVLVLHPDRNRTPELPASHHCVVKSSSRCATSPSNFCLALARTGQLISSISDQMEY